jgi:predicted phosphodiesterase
MRVALISDLHSNRAALRAVLRDMPRVERVICAGDLVGYCAEPNEVVEEVRRKKIQTVHGDHDHVVVTQAFRRLSQLTAKVALWTRQNLTEENLGYLRAAKQRLEIKTAGIVFSWCTGVLVTR